MINRLQMPSNYNQKFLASKRANVLRFQQFLFPVEDEKKAKRQKGREKGRKRGERRVEREKKVSFYSKKFQKSLIHGDLHMK